MEIYLIRHGIAVDRADYSNDEQRPLTDQGRKKTQKVAQKLFQIGLQFDLILTSPLIRAYQTAILLKEMGLSEQLKTFAPLSPDGDIQDWITWLSQWRYNNNQKNSLALVGHQPDLGNWAELLVWGKTQEKLVVKKAGIIGLRLPETETLIGKSELFLLTSPKWLL
jgi:phosphohistidine phosphatase